MIYIKEFSNMVYEIDSSPVLVLVDRAKILDISIGDWLHVKGFPETSYKWTQQDSELVENNPYADLYLKIEQRKDGTYRVKGLEISDSSSLEK